MKVIITKRNGKNVEFEIDENYKFLLEICSFCVDGKGYIVITGNKKNHEILNLERGRLYILHRIIYMHHHKVKLEKYEHIDHIDRDKKNNRISNLRKLTNEENAKNRSINEGQIYYNIYYRKYQNIFKFMYIKYKIYRAFLNLKSALNFFDYIDKKYNYELSKHIHNFIPTSSIKNIWLKPYDTPCNICGATFWSENSYDYHMDRCDGNLRKMKMNTLQKSKIILDQFT